eukprot:353364-Chlamydomonas_euryale.AAC.11
MWVWGLGAAAAAQAGRGRAQNVRATPHAGLVIGAQQQQRQHKPGVRVSGAPAWGSRRGRRQGSGLGWRRRKQCRL